MVDKSEEFALPVRVGYAARGVVYVLLGYLALSSAGQTSTGPQASFDFLQDVPLGSAVLYMIVALGLVMFGVFSLIVARYRIFPEVRKGDLKPTLW
jgi:hypothetical protein